MADTIVKICSDIEAVRKNEATSPAEDRILDICERLARRIAVQQATLTRKIERLDSSTADARLQAARF